MRHTGGKLALGIVVVFVFVSILLSSGVNATSHTDELEGKIGEKESEIQDIEKEINDYQNKVNKTSKEANTLKSQVSQLDRNAKKIGTDIRLTNKKIEASSLNIEKLAIEITDKENNIKNKRVFLKELIKNLNEADQTTMVEIILSHDRLSDFFNNLDWMNNFQDRININLTELRSLKKVLGEEKEEEETEKQNSEILNSDLIDQKKLVDINKSSKDKLLKETKNKESNYKKILAEKEKLKDEFEKELREYESRLRIVIDPGSIPPAEHGILSWPLDKIYITQTFGNTNFAKSGAYNGRGHNGIDFRARTPQKVKAVLGGVVTGTGNTDAIKGCYSWGKWVLVDHKNGLSTIYAHMSLIKVTKGQEIKTGDVVGYSGNTGYSTGSHLHLTVYATQGVRIVRLGDVKTITNCGDARIPVAPLNTYLNPMEYLPVYK